MPENAPLPRNIQGSFTCRKSTTWDKRLYFPSEGRRAEDFFALKNPTASAGFEPGYRSVTFNPALGIGLDYMDLIYVVQYWPIVEWPVLLKTVMNFEVPYMRATS